MIQIFVNGKELVLYSDTTLNIEYNNAMFASEQIEGDIVYSFELPVAGNETALDFAHLDTQVRLKEADCLVLFNGLQIIRGKLIVQTSDSKRMTAAIVCNPYPDKFGETKLTDNESEETVISQNPTEHDAKVREFLFRSLDENADIKFAPFADEEAYGSDNDDFGFRGGYNVGKFVNRMVFNQDGTLYETADEFKLSNEAIDLSEDDGIYIEKNRNCLAPQVRLTKILDFLIRKAGYRFINHVNNELSRIFVQSPRALDGAEDQYSELQRNLVQMSRQNYTIEWAVKNGPWEQPDYYWLDYSGTGTHPYVQDGRTIKIPYPGRYHMNFSFMFPVKKTDELVIFLYEGEWNDNMNDRVLFKNSIGSVMDADDDNNYRKSFSGRIFVPDKFCDKQLKLTVRIKGKETTYNNQPAFVRFYCEGPLPTNIGNAVNIFAKSFRLAELLPSVTNAQFLKAVTNDLGLNCFIDSNRREIEIVAFSDIRNSETVDISRLVMRDETKIDRKDKRHKFRLSPLQDFETKNENFKGVMTEYEVPDYGKYEDAVFWYEKANGYIKKEEVEDADESWITVWQLKGGVKDTVNAGEGKKETEENSTVRIPANLTGIEMSENDQLGYNGRSSIFQIIPNIPVKLASRMLTEKSDNPSEIILMYQRDKNKGDYDQNGLEVIHDSMQAAGVGGFSLSPSGENSLGEKYLSEYLKVKNTTDEITYKLLSDEMTAMEILETIRPQSKMPTSQKRLIIADNVKSVPSKIELQLDNKSDKILMQIKAVRLH